LTFDIAWLGCRVVSGSRRLPPNQKANEDGNQPERSNPKSVPHNELPESDMG
jgi:hypothetical protein